MRAQRDCRPDEAGTFVIAGAITRGDVKVNGISPKLLGAFLDKLEEAGLPMELGDDYIRVLPFTGTLKPVDVITLPHPGYPTDLQAQLGALMTQTEGLSIITERIYPNRFMHVPELQRMGADISIEGPSAIIKGASKLSGAPVMASDLRASAALILAAFAAEGDTWIQRIYHLDRGYERFEHKLAAIGAKSSASATKKCPKSCSKSKFMGHIKCEATRPTAKPSGICRISSLPNSGGTPRFPTKHLPPFGSTLHS